MLETNTHYNRTTFYIAISGIFLGLTLLFQYLSSFMPLVPQLMNINLSLIFVSIVFFTTNYKYGMLVLLAQYAISPAVSNGYSPQELIGHTIWLVAALVYIHLILLFKKMKLLKIKYAMVLGFVSTTILSTFIMTLLNGLLFVPLYNLSFGGSFTLGHISAFGINNYWAVIFAVYITGNIINYGVSSIALIPIFKFIRPKLKK